MEDLLCPPCGASASNWNGVCPALPAQEGLPPAQHSGSRAGREGALTGVGEGERGEVKGIVWRWTECRGTAGALIDFPCFFTSTH